MKKITKILAIGFCLVFVAGAAFAQYLPESMIMMRKAGCDFASWNMARIRAMVDFNPASFNKKEVVAAANVIAAIANSDMFSPYLYGPGTDKDVGAEKTKVKPEFFQQQDKVKKLVLTYTKEANKLQKVAHTGDAKAISVQLGKVSNSCEACHALYKKP
jgi:cytochrome c556